MKLVLVVAALAFAGCDDLPGLGVCGNDIVEANLGEDCDGDAEGCVSCRLVCEPANATPDATCPAGFQCMGRDTGEPICLPRQIDATSPGDGAGCTFRPDNDRRWWLAAGLLALLRARRRRTACKRDPSSHS